MSEHEALTTTNTAISRQNASDIVNQAMPTAQLIKQVAMIQDVMKEVMVSGTHYGVIPGCGDKPSLLKPGAEKLAFVFRLRVIINPDRDIKVKEFEGGHREYTIVTHILTGDDTELATGLGSCSTLEGKYRFRNASRVCPKCGNKEALLRSKNPGEGWFCWAKKGGCGATFAQGDPSVENQTAGKVEHDNPPDYYNTVLKMAKKRSAVDAVISATAASDIFTQDVEDLQDIIARESASEGNAEPAPAASKPAAQATATTTAKPATAATAKPKAAPKPAPVAPAAETLPLEADAPPVPEAEGPAPAAVLSREIIAKVLGAFSQFAVTSTDLEKIAGSTQVWTDAHRVWLLRQYNNIKSGSITVETFKAMKYEVF